jgi:hypothetical protein
MKRPGKAAFVTTVLVILAFALAALAPQTALAGWTWDEMTAVVIPDGGSSSPAGADDPSGDSGWTWDEGRPAPDPAP